ncbi:MAG TPA: GNAT family N-acetyltransferase [Arthrobacter sp.]|nr:GNAT family N-acetyltransferase [Arthrobacter sp.]
MAEQGDYPEYWEADVVLRDGGTAHLRPIGPADAAAVQAFHTAQSQNSIYMRFFTYKSKLSNKELKRFTEMDYRDRVAFAIVRGAEIIGIGRYDRLDDPAEAEVAFNISDHHQGRGLGSILLEHLTAAARENGIRKFSAEVLPANRKMLDVFSDAGYEVERHFDDGVVALSFNIDPTSRSRAVMESREHRAEARSIAELLSPSSVAVIGAGRNPGSVGHEVLEHIIEGGFTGPVYAVNPESFEIGGMVSHANVSEIRDPVELAVIAVPYDEVLPVVSECGAAGVRGVVVLTAGFADDGEHGSERQRALVREARANGMRVIGPASLGMINTLPEVSLNASMAPQLPQRGGFGLFSQSAAVGVLLYAAASRRGIGVSSFLSAGNRADVSGNDLMQHWEDDPDTCAAGLYLESIGNPRKFSRIARRLSRRKPVIVAKSDVMGLQLPPGHLVRTTQAPHGALDAMLRQAGVIRVTTSEELSDIAQIVVSQPLPAGPSIAVVSNSLALGKVTVDGAESHDLSVSQLAADLDLDTGMSEALPLLRRRLLEVLQLPKVDAAVVALLPARGVSVENIAAVLHECSVQAGKPVVAAFSGILDPSIRAEGLLEIPGSQVPGPARSESSPALPEPSQALPLATSASNPSPAGQQGLPCYSTPGKAVAALAAVVQYAQWVQRDHGEFVEPEGIDTDAAAVLVDRLQQNVSGSGLYRLSQEEAAELLSHYGISILPSAPFQTTEEAIAAADRLGWPVAIKTMDEHLRHRLDLGGVRLNITGPESLRSNIDQMRQILEPYGTFGLEVQTMARTGQACSLRAIEDPLLGPVVSFGLAGDAVNLLDDWSHRIPPLTNVDVADLVRAPRAARKLFGYQGLPPVRIDALEDLVARLSVLKDEHPELALMEFNPVLVSDTGLSVLNADLRIGNPAQRTDSARRAMRD